MSNLLLQNAGIDTFFEDDHGGLELEGDFFADVFPHDPWGDTMCSEIDEDDLPLTNYLLKFNGDEEEPWESGEELSVEGESVGDHDEEIFELGWANTVDLETAMFDAVDFSHEKENPVDKVDLGRKRVSPVKKTGKNDKKEPVEKSVVVDIARKQAKNPAVKNIVKVADLVQSGVKSKKATTDTNLTKKECQKSQATVKTQAEKAKDQRERKKQYVKELQDTITELKRDKANLQQVTTQLNDKIESLREEVSYLKGVITNQSELATILRSVANTPGISISCSILQEDKGNSGKNNKRKCDPAGKEGVNLNDNSKKRKMDKDVTGEMEINAGVCVHVQSGKVSLEFCAECSKKANGILSQGAVSEQGEHQ